MYRKKTPYSYRSKKKLPIIRIILITGGIVLLFFLGRNMIFLAPYLSDDHRRFREVGKQIELPVSNLPDPEQKNHYQTIINNLQKIVDKDATKTLDWLNLGKAYLYKMRIENSPELKLILADRAIQSLRKGFAVSKSDPDAQFSYYLGEAYVVKGSDYYFDALKSYQAAKKGYYDKDPDLEKKMAYLYLSKGEYTIANKLYIGLLKRDKSPEVYCYAGVSYYYLKKSELAEQYLNYCIDSYKDDPEGKIDPAYLVTAFMYIGRIYLDKNMFDIAENHFRKAQSIDPDNIETLKMIYDLYNEIGNRTQAKLIENRIKEIGKKALEQQKALTSKKVPARR